VLFRAYIAYLGKKPVEKLEKLLREGMLGKEQAAEMNLIDNGSKMAKELLQFIKTVKKKLNLLL